MMTRGAAELLLCGYFLAKVLVVCVYAQGRGEPPPGHHSSTTEASLNDVSNDDGENNNSSEGGTPALTEDMCRGYYDVMGQWDPPFVCRTGSYLYCCGTCGFRFCCAFRSSRLDQTNCGNYDTPPWITTAEAPPPGQVAETVVPGVLSSKEKSNLVVYVVCGIVAMMALVGIFTKLGLEKTHRPHRQNMSRVLAQVMRHPEHSDDIGMHRQPYETMQTRGSVNSLLGSPMNNVSPRSLSIQQPYPTLGEITSPYESSKELNKYASLKAVDNLPSEPWYSLHFNIRCNWDQFDQKWKNSRGQCAEKANENFYTNRRHTVDITAMSSLPMMRSVVDVEPEPSNPYSSPKRLAPKQNGRQHKSTRRNTTAATYGLTLSPNAAALHPAMLTKSWEGQDAATARWQTYVYKTHSVSEDIDELYAARYMPAQPYFVSNSKTEVTV